MNDYIKLNYNDITIIPEVTTRISSRSECNPYDNDGFLPIFASCMSSVVSMENYKNFNDSKIRVVIPRTYSYEERINFLLNDKINFVAFSLNETKQLFQEGAFHYPSYNLSCFPLKICIDLANGHMDSLIEMVKEIKSEFGDKVIIMTGNIANPETYKVYEEAGVDFVRVSIGSGAACITSSLTGVHFPVFSLLKDIYEIKQNINGNCKIVADGGIRDYRDVQKALIYADYVMIGSVLNSAIDSAGIAKYGKCYWNINGFKILRPLKTLLKYNRVVNPKDYQKVLADIKNGKVEVWKEYFGMASKKAQKLINKGNNTNNKLKTSEGTIKRNKVSFSISGWSENETDALRSAMSYTDSKNLEEFKESKWVVVMNVPYNK